MRTEFTLDSKDAPDGASTWAPNRLISRADVCAYLAQLGLDVSPQVVSTWAARGKGPPVVTFMGRRKYRFAEVVAWANNALAGAC